MNDEANDKPAVTLRHAASRADALPDDDDLAAVMSALPDDDDLAAAMNALAVSALPEDLQRLAALWPKIPAAVREGWVATAEALTGKGKGHA